MAIDFPNSATNGQTYADPGTGQTWTYELATNSWTASSLATTGGIVYKGSVDITAAPPTGAKAGEQWSVSTGGTANAGYGPGVTGVITKGSMVMYTGTGWLETSHSVPDATEAAKGIIQLADVAATTTGTDATRAVHPAGLKVELDKKAPLVSPALTGTPTAPTAAAGTNTTQLATTAFVHDATPNASATVPGLAQLADAVAITAGTAGRVVDAAQLKAAVAAENIWDRSSTTGVGGLTVTTGSSAMTATGTALQNVAVTSSSGGGTGLSVNLTVTGGVVTAASVAAAGSGYAVNDTVTIAKAGIAGAAADIVLTVSALAVGVVSPANAGDDVTLAGKLGIGILAPSAPLDLYGANNALCFRIDGGSGASDRALRITNSSNSLLWDINAQGGSGASGFLTLSTNSTPALTINSVQRVGIGTSTVNTTLEVLNSSAPIIRVGDGTRHMELRGGSTTQNAAIGTNYAGGFDIIQNGSAAVTIDKSKRLLVGTSTAPGNASGDAVIGGGGGFIVLSKRNDSVAATSGTLDITVNDGGGGFQGFLAVSNTNASNASERTQATYSVFGRGTQSSIQQIATANGGSSGKTFTVTVPSNGVIRITNTSNSTNSVCVQFFGGTSY